MGEAQSALLQRTAAAPDADIEGQVAEYHEELVQRDRAHPVRCLQVFFYVKETRTLTYIFLKPSADDIPPLRTPAGGAAARRAANDDDEGGVAGDGFGAVA